MDYPWDEPGHSVDEDRLRATNVQKQKGVLYTVCWLPRHMSPNELGVITELGAVRYLLSEAGQEEAVNKRNLSTGETGEFAGGNVGFGRNPSGSLLPTPDFVALAAG